MRTQDGSQLIFVVRKSMIIKGIYLLHGIYPPIKESIMMVMITWQEGEHVASWLMTMTLWCSKDGRLLKHYAPSFLLSVHTHIHTHSSCYSKEAILALAEHVDEILPPDSHAFAIVYGSSSCSILEKIARYLHDDYPPAAASSYQPYRQYELIYLLQPGAYEDFCKQYPFMLTSLLPAQTTYLPSYPTQVTSNLFLSGSIPARVSK